ncbi:HDOD domain-containing protein [Methylobacter sp. G7]|uniref:HDOD domain-containing protein n=1 Tax=Methylobacter sp. G7 TaxID=3230117 RepID=UPI003D809ED3
MTHLKHKFAHLTDLPSMPVLLVEALQQINGQQDLTTLIDKIILDPAMTLRILRIVNSPFYGISREIGSLREAIVLLGFNRVRDVLVSFCFSNMLIARHKDFNYRQLWHHSVAVAECARQLACLSGNSTEFAFTAGLLHDIGRLVIDRLFPGEFNQIINESATPLIETERRILGFDHMSIGGMAAQHWNLPVAIQQAIEQHETPPEADTDTSLGLLVYTANLLIVKAEQSDEFTLADHAPLCAALALINVSIEQAAQCTQRGQQFANQINP